jgi:hypothetical protein
VACIRPLATRRRQRTSERHPRGRILREIHSRASLRQELRFECTSDRPVAWLRGWSRPWWLLLFLCAGLLTLVDALLIGGSTDLFTGGFLVSSRCTPLRFSLFLAASPVFDLALVLFSWVLVPPLIAGCDFSLAQSLAAALMALFRPLAFLYVRYQLALPG